MVANKLEAVRQASAKAAASRTVLEQAIRAARASGVSLRAVAEAAGSMSYETVRRIAHGGSDVNKA